MYEAHAVFIGGRLLEVHARIAAAQGKLMAMEAANRHRAIQGFSDAYGEEAFFEVSEEVTGLALEARRLAEEV